MAKDAKGRSKQQFVKGVLQTRPEAGTREVNRAWTKAGNEGTISPSSVAKVRSELGLSRRPPRTSAATNGRTVDPVQGPLASAPTDELEKDLDRILFRIMGMGGMPEIER